MVGTPVTLLAGGWKRFSLSLSTFWRHSCVIRVHTHWPMESVCEIIYRRNSHMANTTGHIKYLHERCVQVQKVLIIPPLSHKTGADKIRRYEHTDLKIIENPFPFTNHSTGPCIEPCGTKHPGSVFIPHPGHLKTAPRQLCGWMDVKKKGCDWIYSSYQVGTYIHNYSRKL